MVNKNNIKSILVLSVVFIFICIISYGKGGSFLWDHFREASIADSILQGKILYKDVMALFAPLAYYFNAMLFFIFSSNIHVLYWAGIINSAIILIFIYKIMYEISSSQAAFITILSIMIIFVSRMTVLTTTNWFFPYSYSFIYAFSTCIISLFFYILYLKNRNIKHLYLACFFIGLSISFKFDYTCFTIVLLLSFFKLNSLNKFFKGLCFFAIPLVITYTILYIQTGNDFFNILHDEVIYLYKYIKNPLTMDFYKETLPFNFDKNFPDFLFTAFVYFIQFFLFIFLLLFSYYNLLVRLNRKLILYKIIISGLIIFFLLNINPNFLLILLKKPLPLFFKNLIYLNYLTLLLSIILCVYNKIKKIPFTEKEKFVYVLLLISYLINFRSFSAIYISYIGNFNILLFWMLFIYIGLDILPSKFPKINTESYKNTFCIALIFYSLTFFIDSLPNYFQLKWPIKTNKGIFYTSKDYYFIINQLFSEARKNIIGKNKSLLYIPEGPYIHYLLNIPFTDMYLYQLQGHTTPAIGDYFVIEKIKNKKIDYIYIYIWRYEKNIFGKEYGQEIYNYIKKNYQLEKVIYHQKDAVYIYKIKQQQNKVLNFKEEVLQNNLPLLQSLKLK